MLELTKAELQKHNALHPILNNHIQQVINTIPFSNVPLSMKATIAVAQLTSFASQFKRNILLHDGTEVPINAISFVITGSGGGKDSSVNSARKCFIKGYEKILETRYAAEKTKAIAKAIANGEDPILASSEDIFTKYLSPLPPIDIMPTTGPGLIQHINDIGDLELTTGFLYAGEFSDELAYNPDMVENIKILSELYDIGVKQTKYTKGVEHRSKAIQGQAVSALFVGSPGHILYDESTKKKFHVAFMSKLARRSWFCYVPQRIPEPDFSSIDEMLDYRMALDHQAEVARGAMSSLITDVTEFGLSTAGKTLGVSDEVRRMFEVYKRYNNDLADSLANQDSTSALIRRHLQWKAIKLAGAFAIFDRQNTISLSNYVDAIRFCELLDKDMELFERDLNKAVHERFADYIHTLIQSDGKAIVNVHDLKKNNFVSTVSTSKLQELVHLASGYDRTGIYSVINDGGAIQYETIIKTDVVGISFKPIDTAELNLAIDSGNADRIRNAKHAISLTTAYGFEVADTSFAELRDLLEGDFAYSSFRFRNGVRSRDNILGGTKWVTLDIDNSPITASEAHFMLSDINHHIALSSDPNNEYKFRVLIELDSSVELSPIAWKHFYLTIADDLGLKVDPLPQSQIFFSYANRPVLSQLDASPLEARPYVIQAKEREAIKEHKEKNLTSAQAKALLADPLTTFAFAFEAPMGQGSRQMYRMMQYAKLLGASLQQIHDLVDEVNSYWEAPMHPDRIEALKFQASRLF